MPTEVRERDMLRGVARVVLAMLIIAVGPGLAWGGVTGRVREILHAADLRQTEVSVLVVDLDRGEALAEINADEPRIPASNMKLITSSAAIHILGQDYIFRTELRLIQPEAWSPPPGFSPELPPGSPPGSPPIRLSSSPGPHHGCPRYPGRVKPAFGGPTPA